jgi:hypothetical protein
LVHRVNLWPRSNASLSGAKQTSTSLGLQRSEWDEETLLEGSFDAERAMCRFEEANEVPTLIGLPTVC